VGAKGKKKGATEMLVGGESKPRWEGKKRGPATLSNQVSLRKKKKTREGTKGEAYKKGLPAPKSC